MSKNFMIAIAAIVVLLGGIFWFSKSKSPTSNSAGSSHGQVSNHVTGEGKSGVTLIEYGDYECPACYSYEPLVEQIRTKYKKDIFFQFRNFPLVQIHKNAFAGARAAEAASLQNKFWEMHDLLYQNQDPQGQTGWVASSNPLSFFSQFAQQLNLDVNKFKQDFASTAVNDVILADMDAGKALGAKSTPTFVLNGKKVAQNPRSQEEFNKLIDAAIAAKK